VAGRRGSGCRFQAIQPDRRTDRRPHRPCCSRPRRRNASNHIPRRPCTKRPAPSARSFRPDTSPGRRSPRRSCTSPCIDWWPCRKGRARRRRSRPRGKRRFRRKRRCRRPRPPDRCPGCRPCRVNRRGRPPCRRRSRPCHSSLSRRPDIASGRSASRRRRPSCRRPATSSARRSHRFPGKRCCSSTPRRKTCSCTGPSSCTRDRCLGSRCRTRRRRSTAHRFRRRSDGRRRRDHRPSPRHRPGVPSPASWNNPTPTAPEVQFHPRSDSRFPHYNFQRCMVRYYISYTAAPGETNLRKLIPVEKTSQGRRFRRGRTAGRSPPAGAPGSRPHRLRRRRRGPRGWPEAAENRAADRRPRSPRTGRRRAWPAHLRCRAGGWHPAA